MCSDEMAEAKMTGIDTNILLRFFLKDDKDQLIKARHFLANECTRENPGYVSTIVLCEMILTIKIGLKRDRSFCADLIQSLLDIEHIVVEDHDLVRLALKDYRSSKAGFADCLMGRRNARAGCHHTITFDKAASKLASFELLS